LISQKIDIQNIWKQKEINIAIAIYGLMKNVKQLDVLDCVACYCRCDPLKSGVVNTTAIITLLSQKMNDVTNFSNGIKLKKW